MGEPTARAPLVHAIRDQAQIWGADCYRDGDDRSNQLFKITCMACLASCAANGPSWMGKAAAERQHELSAGEPPPASAPAPGNWKAWYADHLDAVAARDRLRGELADALAAADGAQSMLTQATRENERLRDVEARRYKALVLEVDVLIYVFDRGGDMDVATALERVRAAREALKGKE